MVRATESDDANAALLRIASDDSLNFQINKENAFVIGIALMVLFVNLEAVAYFSYSIPELLAQVKRGNDLALFQAVRLDPSVLQTVAASDRVSKAALCSDNSFFHALALAITKTKPTVPKAHLNDVRLLMHMLEDAGELSSMSNSRLTDIAVNRLGIYPDSGDPLSAIRDQRRKRNRARGGPKS